MALVVHTSRDVVSLPDYGLSGADGARFILVRITPFTARVDVSRNRLGSYGVKVLAEGLIERWRSWRDPSSGSYWGLDELNLAGVELGDEGLMALLDYVRLDVRLQKLMLQNNELMLGPSTVQSLLDVINSPTSPLEILSLSNNLSISHSSISTLFESLDSPHLRELHLSACNLGSSVSGPISTFLRSSRSSHLDRLELNANALGPSAVTEIVSALEEGNFTLSGSLGLFANEPNVAVPTDDDGIALQPTEMPDEASEPVVEGSKAQEDAIAFTLPAILARNRTLTRRTRRAAMRTLAPARIILLGRGPNANEIARQVIGNLPSTSSSATPSRFDILALPIEIIHTIIKHVRDADAFSSLQWTRFLEFACDRTTIGTGMTEYLNRVGMERWELSSVKRAIE